MHFKVQTSLLFSVAAGLLVFTGSVVLAADDSAHESAPPIPTHQIIEVGSSENRTLDMRDLVDGFLDSPRKAAARWPYRFKEHMEYFSQITGSNPIQFGKWAARVLQNQLSDVLTYEELNLLTMQLQMPTQDMPLVDLQIESLAIETIMSELVNLPDLNKGHDSFFSPDRVYALLNHPLDERNPNFETARRIVRSVEYRKNPEHFIKAMLNGLQKQFKLEGPLDTEEQIRIQVRQKELIRTESDPQELQRKLIELENAKKAGMAKNAASKNRAAQMVRREMIQTLEDQIFKDGYESGYFYMEPIDLLFALAKGGRTLVAAEIKTWLMILAVKHQPVLEVLVKKATVYEAKNPAARITAQELVRVVAQKQPGALQQLQKQIEASKKWMPLIEVAQVNQQINTLKHVLRIAAAAGNNACALALSGDGQQIKRLPQR